MTVKNLDPRFILVCATPTEIAIISHDGQVSINWPAAEMTVAEARADQTTLAIARLMIAIRDGTWRPLPASPETAP